MVRDVLLTYGAPFLGAVLLSIGIAGGVMGGYSAVQERADLCGDPLISVATQEQTADRVEGYESGGPRLDRIDFGNLTAAEQAAFEEAIGSQRREGAVDGNFSHRDAIEEGVLVRYEGDDYYVTLASENTCVGASPLLLPLGIVSIILGIVGVAAPPLYRRYVAFEQAQQGK